jgi:putative ABC transport system permease protein
MLDTLIQDLRYAVRSLRSSPTFSAVAILSLALGIGANTAIFGLVNAVILRLLPVSHPEELVQVWADGNYGYFTNPTWEQIRDRQDVFSGISAFTGTRFNLSVGGEAPPVQAYFTSGQFFDTLGVRPFIGRVYTIADDKRGCAGIAVLSYSLWEREYGRNPDVIGKTISLDAHPFAIIGVSQAGFTGIDVGLSNEVFAPLCTEPIVRGESSQLDRRANWWMQIIARPKPAVTPAQASAKLRVLSPGIFEAAAPPNYNSLDKQSFLNTKLSVRPAAGGVSTIRSQYRLALLTLMIVVGAVLMIACVNVANLLLARGAARQRDIAIRLALGSSRARLMSQFLTESLLLSLLGASFGVAFAQWGSHILLRLLSSARAPVYLELTVDGRILAFTAGVAILSGLLFGIAPAWRGTRVQPETTMRANARGVIEGSRVGLGKALVALQVALSFVLISGAGLMLSTFFKLSTVDTGFDRDQILLVQVDLRNARVPSEGRAAAFDHIIASLRALPGVTSASGSDNTPISGSSWSGDVSVHDLSGSTHVYFNQVSPHFFGTLGTPLMAGRDFNVHDTLASPKVAIINQTMARQIFGNENPLGRHFHTVNGNSTVGDREIVGVVRDAKYSKLRDAAPPTAYIALAQDANPGHSAI